MRTTLIGLLLIAAGLIIGWRGYSTFRYETSFTEPVNGIVNRRDNESVVVKIHEEHITIKKNVRSVSDSEFALPLNRQTAHLKAGDPIVLYHARGKTEELRYENQQATLFPKILEGAGAAMIILGTALILFRGEKAKRFAGDSKKV